MKSLKKISLLAMVITSLLISGCYTVLWTPEEELPNESNYQPDSYGYYTEDYYYYYDYPWWLAITPSSTDVNGSKYERDRDKNISNIRNSGNGRGNEETRRDVLTTPPPTIDTGSSNNSDNSNRTQNTEVRKSTDSGSSSSSNNSGRQSSSNNSTSVRNNDGGRNNGGGRK